MPRVKALSGKVHSVLGLLALLLFSTGCFANELRGPVDLGEQRTKFAGTSSSGTCPQRSPLPKRLSSITFYTDPPYYSRIDPERERLFYEAVAPIRNAEESIARSLSNYVRADAQATTHFGVCALSHLLQFATDNAMVETTDGAGTAQVRLFSVTPVFAYVLLRDRQPVSPEEKIVIEGWIGRLARQIISYQRTNWYGNNIDYWGAAGLALAGVALGERDILDVGLGVAKRALDDVNDVGLLPREMARGDAALEYSLFATQALAVIAAVADRNGIVSLRERNRGAVLRLMRAMANAVIQPETFVRLSGNPATVAPKRIYSQNLAWTAFAAQLTSDKDLRQLACAHRPLYSFRAGGDWNVFYGDPAWCKP